MDLHQEFFVTGVGVYYLGCGGVVTIAALRAAPAACTPQSHGAAPERGAGLNLRIPVPLDVIPAKVKRIKLWMFATDKTTYMFPRTPA